MLNAIKLNLYVKVIKTESAYGRVCVPELAYVHTSHVPSCVQA